MFDANCAFNYLLLDVLMKNSAKEWFGEYSREYQELNA